MPDAPNKGRGGGGDPTKKKRDLAKAKQAVSDQFNRRPLKLGDVVSGQALRRKQVQLAGAGARTEAEMKREAAERAMAGVQGARGTGGNYPKVGPRPGGASRKKS